MRTKHKLKYNYKNIINVSIAEKKKELVKYILERNKFCEEISLSSKEKHDGRAAITIQS